MFKFLKNLFGKKEQSVVEQITSSSITVKEIPTPKMVEEEPIKKPRKPRKPRTKKDNQ